VEGHDWAGLAVETVVVLAALWMLLALLVVVVLLLEGWIFAETPRTSWPTPHLSAEVGQVDRNVQSERSAGDHHCPGCRSHRPLVLVDACGHAGASSHDG
jgi:hypothetical protein